jgi:hypothetical protein
MIENSKSVQNDDELDAGPVEKGKTYPKNRSEPKAEIQRPPKGLTLDQYTPDDSNDPSKGGWATFTYSHGDPKSVKGVEIFKDHVEAQVRKAGYSTTADVLPYERGEDYIRVAVRYV